ncbi:hypothetical protein ACFSL4_04490 [Streptomyces caeni]|uniref:Uncharacterized protein n=1 Tax=Streptomyces caeni TaxID=2307231 RepID=A0ABW4IL76_9ACTN
MMNSRVRGTRAGKRDTRAQIFDVARCRFLPGGHQAVTLPAGAAEAGVGVAPVGYCFGSGKDLTGAAPTPAVNPAEPLARAAEGEPATFPQRILCDLLALWPAPRTTRP